MIDIVFYLVMELLSGSLLVATILITAVGKDVQFGTGSAEPVLVSARSSYEPLHQGAQHRKKGASYDSTDSRNHYRFIQLGQEK